MKKTKKTPVILFFIFCLLLSITTLISFSSNTTTQEVLIKSIKPVYDETSTIEVDNNNVVFNDKNQVVKYNVVLENTQDYDVKISDIKLSTPSEEFLSYKVEGISTEDEIKANSTKELTILFETMGIKGWGRNFADELTTNISFEKIAKQEVVPPVEEDKEEEKQPEAPATKIEEIITKSKKIEVNSITNNIIEFKEDIKVEEGKKVAVWIYSNPKFLGYFDVVEKDGVKQIVGLEEAIKKAEITTGEHSIVLATEEKEVLGYVNIYINENKELLIKKPQDPTDKEDSTINKPSEDLEEEPKEDETGKVENPYTSDKELVGILCIATCITGVSIIIVSKNKLIKYTVFVLMLSPAFTITNAEEVIEVAIKNNVSFKSQNVMKMAYTIGENDERVYHDYWAYNEQLKNFYIVNEISEISEYEYKFDVTEAQDGRVIAYLVKNKEDSNYFDVYLVADGIIYPNEDASFYFDAMINLEQIVNLGGLDTSEVKSMFGMFQKTGSNVSDFKLDVSSIVTCNATNMMGMFNKTGYNSKVFTLDVSNFDTSKVTNMRAMFQNTGYNSTVFTLDVSNFDTSKVTDMTAMFSYVGYSNPDFTLDVSKFETGNVTDIGYMFSNTGYHSTKLVLDVSNFDTSKVTNMRAMFYFTGYSNPDFTLDVSKFETGNVTDMGYMFSNTGYHSTKLVLDVSNFDTSKVTNMIDMFRYAAYNSKVFTLDVSNFDTSKVTDMSYMFADAGYNSTEFSIDVSNFDTSNLVNAEAMFYNLGYSSNKVDTSFTIKNPNVENYSMIFNFAAQNDDSQMKINYTSETEELVDKMIATKTKHANVVKGNLIVDVDNLSIGDEIHISGEKFNVISQTEETITLLAQYNLSADYKQSTTSKTIRFSDSIGWEYTPGPKEIDIETWSANAKPYVNAYVEYLKNELDSQSITGDLITLKELKQLGCTISDEYTYSSTGGYTCSNSPYKLWLVNNQSWWTRSANSKYSQLIWLVSSDGNLNVYSYGGNCGVRPVITISKETLRNLT